MRWFLSLEGARGRVMDILLHKLTTCKSCAWVMKTDLDDGWKVGVDWRDVEIDGIKREYDVHWRELAGHKMIGYLNRRHINQRQHLTTWHGHQPDGGDTTIKQNNSFNTLINPEEISSRSEKQNCSFTIPTFAGGEPREACRRQRHFRWSVSVMYSLCLCIYLTLFYYQSFAYVTGMACIHCRRRL